MDSIAYKADKRFYSGRIESRFGVSGGARKISEE